MDPSHVCVGCFEHECALMQQHPHAPMDKAKQSPRTFAALGRSAGSGAIRACSSFCVGAVRPGSSARRPSRRSLYLLPPALRGRRGDVLQPR